MQNTLNWYEHTDLLNTALANDGAFLVAKDATKRPNAMTIGWGQVGIIWSRPMFTVLVRRSRYTHSCLLENDAFTVCVPARGRMSSELAFCGSRSGRDVNKAEACGLSFVAGKTVSIPVIAGCSLYYECKIVLRKELSASDFSSAEILDKFYQDGDHHMIVIGEIAAVYGCD